MPYRCVHCSEIYEDDSKEVLIGCAKCKSKFFFYIKREKLNEILNSQNKEIMLSEEEKDQIEQDVREIAGLPEEESPVFLDFESIKVIKPGKYALDIEKLLSTNKPRIYQLEDGKYIVDLASKI